MQKVFQKLPIILAKPTEKVLLCSLAIPISAIKEEVNIETLESYFARWNKAIKRGWCKGASINDVTLVWGKEGGKSYIKIIGLLPMFCTLLKVSDIKPDNNIEFFMNKLLDLKPLVSFSIKNMPIV